MTSKVSIIIFNNNRHLYSEHSEVTPELVSVSLRDFADRLSIAAAQVNIMSDITECYLSKLSSYFSSGIKLLSRKLAWVKNTYCTYLKIAKSQRWSSSSPFH